MSCTVDHMKTMACNLTGPILRKQAMRDEIQKQVEAFVRQGGKIQQVPIGVSGLKSERRKYAAHRGVLQFDPDRRAKPSGNMSLERMTYFRPKARNASRGLHCYQCEKKVAWLAPDARCSKCTRMLPEEV